jgi:hypothetical protein
MFVQWLVSFPLGGMQISAVEGFLAVLRSYLESLCTNLRSHTITNVQSNNDKVGYMVLFSNLGSIRMTC